MKNPRLNQFTTSELEAELLKRQKCQFNRLTCTQKAESYLIQNHQSHPACFNCQQDILSLEKSYEPK